MSFVFWVVAALTVAGALAAVLMRNLVHCALALTVAFAGLALLYLELHAEFAGFAQILVYIGAVAILMVFAILLTRGAGSAAAGGAGAARRQGGVFSPWWPTGFVVAAAVFAVLGWAVLKAAPALFWNDAPPQVAVVDIGHALMGRYVLALEIVAVLLTAALIGAVIVAMHERERTR